MPIDGHYADLRPPAQAARPYPATPDAGAAANRQAAAATQLGLDLEQHSAAALAFLHEVSGACCDLHERDLHDLALAMWDQRSLKCSATEQTANEHLPQTIKSNTCNGLRSTQVHQHPRLANPSFLAAAVSRYECCWLPLLAAHACPRFDISGGGGHNASGYGGFSGSGGAAQPNCSYGGPLAAPLDVAWVWFAHAIAPAAYRKVVVV